MTLKEVKKHFKNAKRVKELSEYKEVEFNHESIHSAIGSFWVNLGDMIAHRNCDGTWELAKIIEYKRPVKWVEVRNHDSRKWKKRIYLTTIEGSDSPFITVCDGYTKEYQAGDDFVHIKWEQMREIPQQKELTMQEIADKFNIEVEQLKIKK